MLRKLAWWAASGSWGLLVRCWKWWALQRLQPSTNHGSARFVGLLEAKRAKLLGQSGLILGRLEGKLLRHPSNEANMVVFAPQGAGKGVGVVIPNLLSHPGSVICIDPKGENFAVTARKRLEFGPVFMVSMAEAGPSHCFNPLDTVVMGSGSEVAQAARLAELIMPHEVTMEGHWRTKSVQLATGLILHVAHRFNDEPARRNLGMVHAYLTLPGSSFTKLIEAMQDSPLRVVQETASEFARAMKTNEGLSIISNMLKGTAIFSLGRRSGVVCSRSDFAIEEFFGRAPASLYLQVPLGELSVYASWMRVMVGLANHASLSAAEVPEQRPLFVLDEAATLGEIKELQDTIGQGRAYHQKMFIYQDLAQLKLANRGWASVLANCQIHMAFAVNEMETAELLSKRIGDKTVISRSFGVSSDAGDVLSHHENAGLGEHGRRLMQPSEILTMDADKAVISAQGLGLKGPILASRLLYYREAMFQGAFGAWRGSGREEAARLVFAGTPALTGPLAAARPSVAAEAASFDGVWRNPALGYDDEPLPDEYGHALLPGEEPLPGSVSVSAGDVPPAWVDAWAQGAG